MASRLSTPKIHAASRALQRYTSTSRSTSWVSNSKSVCSYAVSGSRKNVLPLQARNNLNWEDEMDLNSEDWGSHGYGDDDDLSSYGLPEARDFPSSGRGKKGKKGSKKKGRNEALAAAQENMMEDSFYDSLYDEELGGATKAKGGKKNAKKNKRARKAEVFADGYLMDDAEDEYDTSVDYGKWSSA